MMVRGPRNCGLVSMKEILKSSIKSVCLPACLSILVGRCLDKKDANGDRAGGKRRGRQLTYDMYRQAWNSGCACCTDPMPYRIKLAMAPKPALALWKTRERDACSRVVYHDPMTRMKPGEMQH